MILAGASGGIVAIVIATWAQVSGQSTQIETPPVNSVAVLQCIAF